MESGWTACCASEHFSELLYVSISEGMAAQARFLSLENTNGGSKALYAEGEDADEVDVVLVLVVVVVVVMEEEEEEKEEEEE